MTQTILIRSFNLADAEKQLIEIVLRKHSTIVEAAAELGITRHALKRRIIKHNIAWPPLRN